MEKLLVHALGKAISAATFEFGFIGIGRAMITRNVGPAFSIAYYFRTSTIGSQRPLHRVLRPFMQVAEFVKMGSWQSFAASCLKVCFGDQREYGALTWEQFRR